ncbi:MFS transporter [Zeimonas arvi]|uniref:MFS transporter n=1 Tax=Zeimonas arvi TaxID=2498847 RepID=UPI00164F3192|nr:MFS transporter [Zeimonas arvi]
MRLLLPAGTAPHAGPVLVARALRAFADGYVAVLLPAYLLALGLGTLEVGIAGTATMLGSALATLAVGAWGHRFARARLLRAAALLMLATGIGFAASTAWWPLLVIAFVGTMNPSSGDVSVFLPLEQATLAGMARGHSRTALFARYSVLGALCAAVGALAAAVPDWLSASFGLASVDALRIMFAGYGAIGAIVWWLYRRLPEPASQADAEPAQAAALGPSRAIVVRLAVLFSVDNFASGLVVHSLLALWLFERFDLSLAQAGQFFFVAGLLSAASQLASPIVARRIGLVNTMVFTHMPANLFMILAAFAPTMPVALGLLLARSALSQMDVPPRTAYVMGVVTPAERAAAASFTAVPKSLAAALSPSLGGAMLAAGWLAAPLLCCGALKLAYDLTLWRMFSKHPPREE